MIKIFNNDYENNRHDKLEKLDETELYFKNNKFYRTGKWEVCYITTRRKNNL